MIGAVKHVEKALEAGVDIICAQGGEGGGHTGLSASIRMYTQSKNVTMRLIVIRHELDE